MSNGERVSEEQTRAIAKDNDIRSRIKKIMSVIWTDSYMAKYILKKRGYQTEGMDTEVLSDDDYARLLSKLK